MNLIILTQSYIHVYIYSSVSMFQLLPESKLGSVLITREMPYLYIIIFYQHI